MDDVRAYSVPSPVIIDETLKENISITLGIIPNDLEKDRSIVNYLNKIKSNPRIEIAQHGLYHSPVDSSLSEDELLQGYGIIEKEIGVKPVTYIPPYNNVSASTLRFIKKYFKVISSSEVIMKINMI